MEYAFFIGALIGMRAKVVTLCLNQVRWQYRRTVAVVVSDSGGEGRSRDTVLYGIRHNIAQRLLIVISGFLEVRRQQQVRDGRILCVGVSDFLQELSTNNAARAENFRDFAVVR